MRTLLKRTLQLVNRTSINNIDYTTEVSRASEVRELAAGELAMTTRDPIKADGIFHLVFSSAKNVLGARLWEV